MSDELKAYVEEALNSDKISLITIKNGAAIEMFDLQLARVMNNIADINTTSKAREITLKVKVTPINNSRSMVAYSIDVPPAKLCGQEPVEGHADVSIDAGGSGAYARRREPQEQMKITNVVKMDK